MVEQFHSLIDTGSIKYSRDDNTVYALGTKEHQGELFYLLAHENPLTQDLEKALTRLPELARQYETLVVVGTGVDEETFFRSALKLSGDGVSIWALDRNRDPRIFSWLKGGNTYG